MEIIRIMKPNMTYKDAGVDTKEGQRAVELMKDHVKRTFNENVLKGLGSFGSFYKLDTADMEEPVLVSGTDGVGTKLRIAFLMDKHDTVGQDCVAMCVNDIVCQGAAPLFFLDYIATGKVRAEKIADIVKGIADGCVISECALVGGETAEMPSFYADGEYDMAGFAVGVVDKKNIIDGSNVAEGDVIIGIPSSGIHSNGYSLVRKVLLENMNMDIQDYAEELGTTIGEALLTPTRIYVRTVRAVLEKFKVNAIVHITGGGFYENIPRVLPEGLCAEIDAGSWNILPIFGYIAEKGGISEKEMYSTFNMGIGMMLIAGKDNADDITELIREQGEEPAVIGRITRGSGVKIVSNGKVLE